MISTSLLLGVVVQLIIGGLILYVLYWGLGKLALPDPIGKIALGLLVVVVVIWLINILLSLGGRALF
jgi:hypothetical protein